MKVDQGMKVDQSKYNALVLLGYHGVGKDTLTDLLIKDNPQCVNVKMSKLYKSLLGDALGYTSQEMDGKDSDRKREQKISLYGKQYPLSVLDLLNLMFLGSLKDNKFVKAHVDYAISSIPENRIPVFTDIRREEELAAVYVHFTPFVVYLDDPEIQPSEADENIDNLKNSAADASIRLTRGYAHQAYSELLDILKDVLVLFNSEQLILQDYIDKLLQLNAGRLPEPNEDPTKAVAHYYFGLIEEITEFQNCAEVDELGELGDILAYLVLSLYATQKNTEGNTTTEFLAYLLTDSHTLRKAKDHKTLDASYLVCNIASCAKRYFREGKTLEPVDLVEVLLWVSSLIESNYLSLKEVLDYNIQKLTDRKSRGVMFEGSGNNR